MSEPKAQRASGSDPARVDAKHYKVEMENDKVRVLRCKYGPGEKSVMHDHPPSVAIFLTPARVRFTYPDGRTEENSGEAGHCMYLDAMSHLPENLGDKPFEVLVIEMKS